MRIGFTTTPPRCKRILRILQFALPFHYIIHHPYYHCQR